MLRRGREGVLPGADPVPGAARRHRAQLRTRCWSTATHGRSGSGCSCVVASVQEAIDNGSGARAAGRHAQPDPDAGAARRPGEVRLHRDLRRRPPRRGQGPGQGAGLLLPRRVRPVGPEEPAARAVEPLQRPDPPRREHPGLPAVELDRARHLAVHRSRRRSSCRRIYYAHEREVFERGRHALRRPRGLPARAERDRVHRAGPLPHRRRRQPHRGRALRRRHDRQGHRRGRHHPHHRARCRPEATTSSARPPWRTARSEGYF